MSIPVRIEVFEGPLDLLLHLIDKNKLNIYDIPIVTITDQYLEYIHTMESNKMEVMSEFIEMAAILINIKSKTLLPEDPKEEEEEVVDPRQQLIDRLVEYKKFKLIASQLRSYHENASKMVFKDPTIPDEVLSYIPEIDPKEIIGDLDLSKLYDVFRSVMKKKINKIDPIRSKFGEIRRESCTVDDKMIAIEKMAGINRKLSFRHLLEEQHDKIEIIVTFLAILELMKIGRIKIFQNHIFDEILLEWIG